MIPKVWSSVSETGKDDRRTVRPKANDEPSSSCQREQYSVAMRADLVVEQVHLEDALLGVLAGDGCQFS